MNISNKYSNLTQLSMVAKIRLYQYCCRQDIYQLYDSITLILNQPPDSLVLILFGENVFMIDSVQSKVD